MGNSVSGSGGGGCMNGDHHVTKKETERGESESIRYAVSGMKGLRQTMEDQHIHRIGLPVKTEDTSDVIEDHAIFGVFDGHGGDFTAKYLADNFLDVLSQREELIKYSSLPKTGSRGQSDVNAVVLLQKALVKTFVQLDEQLFPIHKERTAAILSGKINPAPIDPESDIGCTSGGSNNVATTRSTKLGERSGSTAVVVLLTPSHLICANTGDSRAILRRNGRTLPLSFDHKPSELPERLRIHHANGFVKGRRVNGDLAVSRAFGDFSYKQQQPPKPKKQPAQDSNSTSTPSTLPQKPQKVVVLPDIMIYPRFEEEDEFMILACDGIWDVASSEQCAHFVQVLLQEGESDLGSVCEEILDTCLDRRSRDNMTIMLVGLPALKMDTSSSAVMNNALWGYKAARQRKEVTQGGGVCSRMGMPGPIWV